MGNCFRIPQHTDDKPTDFQLKVQMSLQDNKVHLIEKKTGHQEVLWNPCPDVRKHRLKRQVVQMDQQEASESARYTSSYDQGKHQQKQCHLHLFYCNLDNALKIYNVQNNINIIVF